MVHMALPKLSPLKNYYLPIDRTQDGSCIATVLINGQDDAKLQQEGYRRVSFLEYACQVIVDMFVHKPNRPMGA
jgi:hypothetical protein